MSHADLTLTHLWHPTVVGGRVNQKPKKSLHTFETLAIIELQQGLPVASRTHWRGKKGVWGM